MTRPAMLLVGTILTLYVSAFADVPMFPIYEIAAADMDVSDGTLADWEAAVPGPSLTLDNFASIPSDCGDCAGVSPTDLDYRVYLGFDVCTQTLWIGVERVDDVHISAHTGGDSGRLWNGDTIEFMVDGDHSGGKYNGFTPEEFTRNGWDYSDEMADEMAELLSGYQAQHYYLVPDSPDGVVVGSNTSASGWVTALPWAAAGGSAQGVAPTTSVIEGYVTPWDALDWHGSEVSTRSTLADGRVIGFQIAMPDWDVAGTLHAFHTISGQANTWRTADSFVDGELVCPQYDCSDLRMGCWGCAVQADSWGRIKAGLE
jgi:hypothetical protein